jgi:hypothetical protein
LPAREGGWGDEYIKNAYLVYYYSFLIVILILIIGTVKVPGFVSDNKLNIKTIKYLLILYQN